MQTDYHIEELVHQTENLVVYRVTTRDQVPFALIRLKYEDDVILKLNRGAYDGALKQLKDLSHNCLRPIVDGGLDPVDGFPWIVARWWDGIPLPDRVRNSDLSDAECQRIRAHADSLIEALGPVAGTVALTPGSIVICGEGDQTIDTFSIDYHSWFAAFAEGVHPADLVNVRPKYNALITYLKRHSKLTSAPLVTAAEAPAPSPAQAAALRSTKGSSSKVLLILVLLVGAIGFFAWKVLNQGSASEKEPPVIVSEPLERNKPTGPLPANPGPPDPPTPPIAKETPELKPTARPKNSNGFLAVDPTSPYSLDGKVGRWITFQSSVDDWDENDRLVIPDSTIRVTLPPATEDLAKSALRNRVTFRGFLSSPTSLKVVNPDDIQINYLLQEFYTIDDEPQIRQNFAAAGQIIPLRAMVQDLTKSQSGKTSYLQFKPAPPEFTGRIEKSKAEPSLNDEYLKSLVGKTIEVKGRVRKSTGSSRISIVITKKSQIKIIE